MRRLFFLLLAGALLLPIVTATPARAQIKMEIVGPGSRLTPIAVSQLKNLGGDDHHELSKRFIATLSRDLELCGYFRLIDPHSYIEDAQSSGFELGMFNFGDWSSLNAEFLVKGSIEAKDRDCIVEVLLYDVPQQRRVMGKKFSGEVADLGPMARKFADALLEATTGTRGPFYAKLAFVSTRGGRFKEIYTSSIEGEDAQALTKNPTINLFPHFDKAARQLLYTSYKKGTPALYLADLAERTEIRIDNQSLGTTIGGTLSPDGKTIAAAIERGGATNLYLLDLGGRETRELTTGPAINVTPAFSPDGQRLAFTSDRSGAPQIYVMDLATGQAHRVTFSGNYNTNPAFSPKGDRIAYQARENGVFDIFTISLSSGAPAKLTDGRGSNESPCWSPDGRYIVFSSTRSGRARLYLLQVETGRISMALMEGKGDDTSAVWSWWLGE